MSEEQKRTNYPPIKPIEPEPGKVEPRPTKPKDK